MDILCTDKTGTLTQDKIALARHTDAYGQDTDEVLNFAFLNSHYQTGLKNLLDRAVLERVELAAELKLNEAYRKVDEIPFDFDRRRMSVVVATLVAGQEHHHELICKGAVEEVLAACTQVRAQDATDASLDGDRTMPTVPLDAALLARTQAVTAALNAEGLRVVAVAVKTLPPDQTTYAVADEAGLTLIGYIAFLDPPKESAAPALKGLAAHGIAVKVLTGDNEPVTRHVCSQVGLAAPHVLLGAQVEVMNDGAVDIANEAADIILLEKSLLVLADGVVEGRTTMSYSRFCTRQTAIPFNHVDAELVTKPLKWNPADIGRFMLFFGPISLLFDVLTFAALWRVFGANSLAHQSLFQSGCFVVGLLTQTLVVHLMRTPKIAFFQSRASAPLMGMTLAIMAVGLWLPLSPLAGYFKLQALPPTYYGWLLAILAGYSVLISVMKRLYVRRYGWQ